jgi:predicted nucleotidyltransferase
LVDNHGLFFQAENAAPAQSLATPKTHTPARARTWLKIVAAKQPGFRVEKDVAISDAGSIIVAMISVDDSKTIRELAAKYSLKKVLLFGSAARQDSGYRDIDLAVEGIRPQDFFRFYGELMSRLSVPVDLLDMSRPKRFSRIVYREGISLYG